MPHLLHDLIVGMVYSVDPVTVKGSIHSGVLHFFDAWRRDTLSNGRWKRVVPGVWVAMVMFPLLYPVTITHHPDWNSSTCYAVSAIGSAFFGKVYTWAIQIGNAWVKRLSGSKEG